MYSLGADIIRSQMSIFISPTTDQEVESFEIQTGSQKI
jgi:hypothetical protein